MILEWALTSARGLTTCEQEVSRDTRYYELRMSAIVA